MPVTKTGLLDLCSFSFNNSVEGKKRVFELLDDISNDTGNTLINHISIYPVNNEYRLKLLINTIYGPGNLS